MSNELDIIRDPRIYSDNDFVGIRSRTPFELDTGVYCNFRNSDTSKFQTFSPYSSTSSNISDVFSGGSDPCEPPVNMGGNLFKHSEDINGNNFYLFKDIPLESTIHQKRDYLGELRITNVNGELQETFLNLNISNLLVRDIQVYFDVILIITENTIYIINTSVGRLYTSNYSTHFDTIYSEGRLIILLDVIPNDYNLFEVGDTSLIPISQTPLTDFMTSSSMEIRSNRVEIVYTDSSISTELVFADYDLNDNIWTGFAIDDFPYEILGVNRNNNDWDIYYEKTSYPNWVGGLRVEFNQTDSDSSGDEITQSTSDLVIDYIQS